MATDDDGPGKELLQLFDDVRRRSSLDRLDVTTTANPGRHVTTHGQLVAAPDKTLWLVGHRHAERLDSVLWGGLHVDPESAHLGRFSVTVEALG